MFAIDEIISGWMNLTFELGDEVFCVMATDIHKTDSAAQLIKMAGDAVSSEGNYFAVLDNEPGAWVIELGNGRITVWLSREDLFGKADVSGCDRAYEGDMDIRAFASEIYDSFAVYSSDKCRDEYEQEMGMPFPEAEFIRLGKVLGRN